MTLRLEFYERRLARLHRLLGTALPGDFLQLLWGLEAVSEGRADAARAAIPDVPQQAIGAEMGSPYSVFRWELETLASEYIVSHRDDARILNCRTFNAARRLLNELKGAENAEARLFCTPENVLQELQRIGQRQFHWQRGYLNKAAYYRSARLYFGPSCVAYMRKAHNLTPDDLSLVGFYLYGAAANNAGFLGRPNLSQLGVYDATRDAALQLLCCSYDELRRRQAEARRAGRPIAYQPLMLRRTPLVELGPVMYVPLRDLILMRTTTGLYYDLVPAGGGVLQEIGSNFERYAEDLLRSSLLRIDVERERPYRGLGKSWDTPDLLLHDAGELRILVECKATKMTFDAQFGNDPLQEAPRGFNELAKGIFQIWRFCSHVRRGLVQETLRADSTGVVLTLDYWGMLSPATYRALFAEAACRADADGGIEPQDRIAVAISAVEDFENGLMMCSEDQLGSGLRLAAEEENRGWSLPNVLRKAGLTAGGRPWPFGDQLEEVLPWWGRTKEVRDIRS